MWLLIISVWSANYSITLSSIPNLRSLSQCQAVYRQVRETAALAAPASTVGVRIAGRCLKVAPPTTLDRWREE